MNLRHSSIPVRMRLDPQSGRKRHEPANGKRPLRDVTKGEFLRIKNLNSMKLFHSETRFLDLRNQRIPLRNILEIKVKSIRCRAKTLGFRLLRR